MTTWVFAFRRDSFDDDIQVHEGRCLFDAVAAARAYERAHPDMHTFIQYQQTDSSFVNGLGRDEWHDYAEGR